MRCQWLMGKCDLAKEAAQKVVALEKISDDVKAEAHLIIGKCYSEVQYYDMAIKEFLNVTYLTTSEKNAEAKYNIAYIQFLSEQYKESQKTVFELISQEPSYEFWVGKGFILLSDDYLGLKDVFNAKYALQKLVDKSTNIELVAIAKEKLNRIADMEKAEQDKKLEKKPEDLNIQFKPDNPKDSSLYKQE